MPNELIPRNYPSPVLLLEINESATAAIRVQFLKEAWQDHRSVFLCRRQGSEGRYTVAAAVKSHPYDMMEELEKQGLEPRLKIIMKFSAELFVRDSGVSPEEARALLRQQGVIA